MTGNKNTTIKNFIWRFAERCGAQLVTFIVSIVLARLLAPEDYGTIALVTVFTTILQVFVDSGLGTALIQKKDADDLDFSSVFYFNFFMCIVLYIGMFLAAPIIAGFYGDSSLTGERSGMGFSFMEAFMDKVEVESKVGCGTCVTMKKRIGRGYMNKEQEEKETAEFYG